MDVTSQVLHPMPLMDVAAEPAVAGWLFHVTPVSVQAAASRHASMVRVPVLAYAFSRREAAVTVQPFKPGRLNETRVRLSLPPESVFTNRSGPVPWLSTGLSWST